MKKAMLFLLVVFTAVFSFAEKLAVLPEAAKPEWLVVDGDRVYAVEKLTVYAYEMKDFKLVKQFIKKGEGPAEAKSSIYLKASQDGLSVIQRGKIMFFSRDGVLKEEKKILDSISRVTYLGENLVGTLHNIDQENKAQYMSINIFDKEFNPIKMLRKGKSYDLFTAPGGGKRDLVVIGETLAFEVYKNNIYAVDTQRGFSITVFDKEGNQLYEINKEYKKIKVPESFKENYLQRFKKNPAVWERTQKMMNFVFPDYYPAIYRFWVKDEKIYVFTYETKEAKPEEDNPGERNLLVLDLKGNILKQMFVPDEGLKSFIDNDGFYYLVENEKDEAWELHVQKIK